MNVETARWRPWQIAGSVETICVPCNGIIVPFSKRKPNTRYGPGIYCLYYFYSNALPSTLASMTLAMSIKLTKIGFRQKRRQQILEKGMQNYITIYTKKGKYITMHYLKTLEENYLK